MFSAQSPVGCSSTRRVSGRSERRPHVAATAAAGAVVLADVQEHSRTLAQDERPAYTPTRGSRRWLRTPSPSRSLTTSSSLRALARADGTGDRGTNGEVKIYRNASS